MNSALQQIEDAIRLYEEAALKAMKEGNDCKMYIGIACGMQFAKAIIRGEEAAK